MSETVIVGRQKVAKRFGVSKTTLERWEKDPTLSRMFQLHRFIFRMNKRVATTERLAVEFIENARKNDPREALRRAVCEVSQ